MIQVIITHLQKYTHVLLIIQMILIVYTVLVLLYKILSGLRMVIYRPYRAVRIVKGTDFRKIIDMPHFIRAYGDD